jgi:hypothetical protein
VGIEEQPVAILCHTVKKRIGKHLRWVASEFQRSNKNSRIIFKLFKSPVQHVLASVVETKTQGAEIFGLSRSQ